MLYDILILIYLLTATGLSPGGSTHLHTNNTQNNTNNNRITQIQTNVEECGPCPVFASFILAFALQRRKKYSKTSVRVRKTSRQVKKNLSQSTVYILQNTHTLQNPHKHTHYKTHTYTHITKPTQTHTLQNSHKHTLQNPHKHTHYKTHTNTHITKPTHTHTHTRTHYIIII